MDQKRFWNDNAANWNQVLEQNLIASRGVTSRAIVQEILNLKPEIILDLGCGEGWLQQSLADKNIRYSGVDVSQNLISIAKRKSAGSFYCAGFEEIATGKWKPDQKFDLAVFNFSLLDQNIADLLKRTAGFLNPQGYILIQTLNPKNLLQDQDGWNEEDFKTMTIPFSGTMPWYGRRLDSWHALFKDCGLSLVGTVEPFMDGKAVSIIFKLSV